MFSYACGAVENISCDGLFVDIVTDKFTAKYPHTEWKIQAYAKYSIFSNGGGAGHAFVGVVPKLKGKNGKELDLIPDWRFSRTSSTTNDVSPLQKNEELRLMLRKATEAMMAQCDASKNCDIDK
jgi:hypothetical protein